MLRAIFRVNFSSLSSLSPLGLFQERKLLYQHTSQQLTQADFVSTQQQKIGSSHPVSAYCGYDPTADSLHIGNLVSIIMMARMHKLLNLRPIFLLGGATGLVGDPSGKKQQRDLLAQQRVDRNLQSITTQIKSVYTKICDDLAKNWQEYGLNLKKQEKNIEPIFINNFQFYKNMNVLTYLRDIGKVLRMNSMLTKQIVANRLQSQNGLSYTQFSYSILQSYDFYMLNKNYGCVLQFGGSDQWGNITNGCDLTKKLSKGKLQSFGITMPLLLTKTGEKFGKSQGNALYLNSSKTPTATTYDYLYNTADDEVQKLLKIFTFYSEVKVQGILSQHKQQPQKRFAQKILAERVTNWLGPYKNIKQQLMKITSQDLRNKKQVQLKQYYEALPKQMKGEVKLQGNQQIKNLPDLLVKLNLSKSRNEARRDIEGEGVYLNNAKIPKNYSQQQISSVLAEKRLSGNYVLLRKGKKKCFLLKFQV